MPNTKIKPLSQVNTERIEDPIPRINLSTSEDIRREMGRVYREARSKKMLATEASKLVYILTQILKATEVYLLEERLSELESAHLKGIT
jgi:predicted nucleic acid-binding protein